ncbi:hypothetical protein GINT2_002351 [Glugoides intestinalis]
MIIKTKKYLKEYVTSVKWLKTLFVPALVAIIAHNFFEVKIQQSLAKITVVEISPSTKIRPIISFCIYFTLGYSLLLLYEIFNAYFVSTSVKRAFSNFFAEYLKIDYQSFSKTGIGEAQYNINRRVDALVDFLSSICVDFVSNMLFFLIAVESLEKEINSLKIKIVLLICTIFFIIFSIAVQVFRSAMRQRVNIGFEICSRKMYDILCNYERITAYDNLEYELELYKKSMDYRIFYGIIFWVSGEIASYINTLFFLGINTYILSVIGVSLKETIDLKGYTLVFNKLKDKMIDMIDNFDTLINNFVNLDQSNIENCPMDEKSSYIEADIKDASIEITNLEFSYDKKAILKNFSMKIPSGQKIAITGINGSGKSTLIKILLGLYDHKGKVEIGGIDIALLSKKKLRSLISYVPQTTFLFDKTVIENLKCGNKDASDEKVIEFAKLYNMHQGFKELGYNKVVGERGKFLSGGERQKICFLRALIKQSQILILDEATSNIDEASELEILENIAKYIHNRTVIMIVHNLKLLKHFDRVLFFEKENVYEEGTFEELLNRQDGNFSKFYNAATDQPEII